MIISASRRTDIPAYYSDWLFNRIKERYVYVRNPMNRHQLRRVNLDPANIDCIVFWTKNPGPMLDRLHLLHDYAYYFQFTLNPYENDIEANLPAKHAILETFKKLSGKIGPQRVVWRYDPVLINSRYTVPYHREKFSALAYALKGYTEKVVFSFIDFYKKIDKNIRPLDIGSITPDDKNIIAENFSKAARENNFTLDTCAEDIDFAKYQIARGCCIDGRLIAKITGRDFSFGKDKNQRRECGCAASTDIGEYNSCRSGCLYCYANHSRAAVEKNSGKHTMFSPLLTGDLNPDDILKVNAGALPSYVKRREFVLSGG